MLRSISDLCDLNPGLGHHGFSELMCRATTLYMVSVPHFVDFKFIIFTTHTGKFIYVSPHIYTNINNNHIFSYL